MRKGRAGILFFLCISLYLRGASAQDATAEATWSALKSGGHIVLIRHALTEAGVGDPPGFVLANCRTQRNLSAQGRADARRIGEAFRRREIPVADVLSSRWCRCLDTARLAFGEATPAAMLDSMFDDSEPQIAEKVRAVQAAVARRPSGGNLVLVTHNRNIQALTGVSPFSGEMVVVMPDSAGKFNVIGRLRVPEE